MRSKFLSRPLAVLAALAFVAAGVRAHADDMPPPAPSAPAAPPAPPVAPPENPEGDALPKPPGDPAKPDAPKEGEADKKPQLVKAPEFILKDLDGKERKLSEFLGKWIVLEWTNYSCPFVKKHYGVKAMQATQKTYTDKGVVWLSICSSAEGKEGFLKPDAWKKAATDAGAVPTAILLDADGTVGRLYGARVTPEIRVIDPKGNFAYTGAVDDDPTKQGDPVKAKNYVALALDAALAGKEIATPETRAYG